LNFQQAINPQITKSYAANDMNYMHKLIFTSSRLSFYIVLLLALPIVFETEYILQLWLKTVPDNTVEFIRLSMIVCAVLALANPLITGNHATGNVKLLLLTVGTINGMVLPLAWIWLKIGGGQTVIFWSWIIIVIVAFIVRLFVVKTQLRFSLQKYLKECLLPIVAVLFICFFAVFGAQFIMSETNLFRLIETVLFSTFVLIASVWLFGVSAEERQLVKKFIVKTIFSKNQL